MLHVKIQVLFKFCLSSDFQKHLYCTNMLVLKRKKERDKHEIHLIFKQYIYVNNVENRIIEQQTQTEQ